MEQPPRVYIAGETGKNRKYINYARAVERAGGVPVFPPLSSPAYPSDVSPGADDLPSVSPCAHCDALILPGGGDVEPWRYGQENFFSRNLNPGRDEMELELLREFTEAEKPVLGICRGIQVINIFFGGDLIQDIPGHHQINGKDRKHIIYHIAPEFLPGFLSYVYPDGYSGAYPELEVNSAHHQAAGKLGAGLYAAQVAEDNIIEALAHEFLPVYGVQWHPERLNAPAGDALFRAFVALSRRRPETLSNLYK